MCPTMTVSLLRHNSNYGGCNHGKQHPTQHLISHFGDESFRAVNCAGTDNWQQRNTITRATQTQKNSTRELVIAKRNIKLQNPGLVTLYDIQPGNRVGLSLQPWSLAQGALKSAQRHFLSQESK